MATEPDVWITGDMVVVKQGRQKLSGARLERVLQTIQDSATSAGAFEVQPPGARIVTRRGDALALAIELPPHSRRVRWLSDDSPVPFGKGAQYDEYYVAFPYVVLLLVLRGGALTGEQQLYYRRQSLDAGDELLLPNLYNVAQGYGQRCWVCLQHAPNLRKLSWAQKISEVVTHIFSGAFNQSSEEHEGNSYWTACEAVDPRVATMAAWQKATHADRRMALDIAWTAAETTASAELEQMLDRVVRPLRLGNATQLAGIVSAAASPERDLAGRKKGVA
ncbi:MAG: hypothetical protein GY944_07450 [bacterium]|nr:hypothetical protein [bacterium]